MSQDVVCREAGGWGSRKIAQVLQLQPAFGSTVLAAPCLSLPVSPSVRLYVSEVGKRRLWGQ